MVYDLSPQVPPDMLSMEVTTELPPDSRQPAGEGDTDIQHPAEFYSSSMDQDHNTPGMETAQ